MPERNKIHLTIDGKAVEVASETTILSAAASVGVEIPTLCYMKGLPPDGSCRLCVVEIFGGRKKGLFTACSEHCAEGMDVRTHSEKVVEARRFILDLLMSNHKEHCFNCPQNGDCRLQSYCMEYGVSETSFVGKMINKAFDGSSPYFNYDPKLCIMCRRCQRTCESVTGKNIISLNGRGFRTRMSIPYDHAWRESACGICGSCVEACPVGALSTKSNTKNYRQWEIRKTSTTCTLCDKACQIDLVTKNNKVLDIRTTGGLTSKNLPCSRGRYTYWQSLENRVNTPLIKNADTGSFEPADWDTALALIAGKLDKESIVAGSVSTTEEEQSSLKDIARSAGARDKVFGGYTELLEIAEDAKTLLVNDTDMVSGCRTGRYCSYCQLYCDTVNVSALNELDFVAVISPAMSDVAKTADVVLPGYSFAELAGTFNGHAVNPAVTRNVKNGVNELAAFMK